MVEIPTPRLGIAGIGIYEPPWILRNDWFGDRIPRKFVQQTGIVSRPISDEDEVAMAVHAATNLQQETQCDWQDCAGVIFSSPSFVPLEVARKYCDSQRVKKEHLPGAARRSAQCLGIANRPVRAVNWFCSGYAKAIAMAARSADRRVPLGRNQFLLVVTTGRISRITDFGCGQTGPLFGDMAAATLLVRPDSLRHSPRFGVLFAAADKVVTDGSYFDFHLRNNVPSPTCDGRQDINPQRLVFSLNGMAIADAAPRAMASARGAGFAYHRYRCRGSAIRCAAPGGDRHRAVGGYEIRGQGGGAEK